MGTGGICSSGAAGPSTGSNASPAAAVDSLSASPDGLLIAAVYSDRWLRLWHVPTAAAVGALRLPKPATAVAFSAARDAPRVAVSVGSELRWYDVYTWEGVAGVLAHVYEPIPPIPPEVVEATIRAERDDQPQEVRLDPGR